MATGFVSSGNLLAFDIIGSKAQEIAGSDVLKGLDSSFLCTPVVVKSIVD